MNLGDLAKDIAKTAVNDLVDGKNIGEIGKHAAGEALERVSGEMPRTDLGQDTPQAKVVNGVLGIIASFLGSFISKLFK